MVYVLFSLFVGNGDCVVVRAWRECVVYVCV